jgi:hypothetical protein
MKFIHLSAYTHFKCQDTRVVWGVNFRSDNLSNAVAQTNAITQAFDSPTVKDLGITLEFIEIGVS